MVEVRLYGDKILRTECTEVPIVDEEFKQKVKDMVSLLTKFEGLGLASNQVGDSRRYLVMNPNIMPEGFGITIIDPHITSHGEETNIAFEGCLSLLSHGVDRERYSDVTVEYKNIDGASVVLEASGLLARVFQHEIDHLDGKLVIDDLSLMKKKMTLKKFQKAKKWYKKHI